LFTFFQRAKKLAALLCTKLMGRQWRRRVNARPAVVFGMLAIVSVPILIWAPENFVDRYGNYDRSGSPLTREQYTRAIDEYRKTFAQILAGMGGIYGLYLLTRRTRANEEGQITERFTRAIEQLGARTKDEEKLLEVRFGGIYALERIAKDSRRDHWPIMEILCAYVRQNARRVDSTPPEHIKVDVQAVLDVICRRNANWDTPYRPIDLRDTNLQGGNFFRAPLKMANFARSVLNGACLRLADLRHSDLCGTDLEGSDLSHARLAGAHLEGASLRGANLTGADLTAAPYLPGDWVPDLSIDIYIACARTAGRSLSRADLVPNATLTGVNFHDAKLNGANLKGADLRHTLNLTPEQIKSAVTDEGTKLPTFTVRSGSAAAD
jgi:hypothetical protein